MGCHAKYYKEFFPPSNWEKETRDYLINEYLNELKDSTDDTPIQYILHLLKDKDIPLRELFNEYGSLLVWFKDKQDIKYKDYPNENYVIYTHTNSPVRFYGYPPFLSKLHSWKETKVLLYACEIFDELSFSGDINHLKEWWDNNPNGLITVG